MKFSKKELRQMIKEELINEFGKDLNYDLGSPSDIRKKRITRKT